jgi:hypothetical protein
MLSQPKVKSSKTKKKKYEMPLWKIRHFFFNKKLYVFYKSNPI